MMNSEHYFCPAFRRGASIRKDILLDACASVCPLLGKRKRVSNARYPGFDRPGPPTDGASAGNHDVPGSYADGHSGDTNNKGPRHVSSFTNSTFKSTSLVVFDEERLISNSEPGMVSELARGTGFRQQHLNTLITVLHRSLLDGDIARAGRTWSLMLRAETGGHSLDMRMSIRWGLGAEVLLKSGALTRVTSPHTHLHDASGTHSKPSFDNEGLYEGFDQIKEYYERLILQNPYRKAFPHVTGPLDFYLAIFGLWVQSIVGKWSVATEILATTALSNEESETKVQENVAEELKSANAPEQRQVMLSQDLLENIHELNNGLDAILCSPPYTDREVFWNLRGMAALWLADLYSKTRPPTSVESLWKRFDDMKTEEWAEVQAIVTDANAGQEIAVIGRGKALLKARDAFQKASLCVDSTKSPLAAKASS